MTLSPASSRDGTPHMSKISLRDISVMSTQSICRTVAMVVLVTLVVALGHLDLRHVIHDSQVNYLVTTHRLCLLRLTSNSTDVPCGKLGLTCGKPVENPSAK